MRSNADSQWRHTVSNKLGLAFSKSQLANKMLELKRLTDDFGILLGQIRSLSTSCSSIAIIPSNIDQGNALRTLRSTRDASMILYNALVSACRTHSEHQAYFGLQPVLANAPGRVRFNLSYKQKTLEGSQGGNNHISFAVVSVPSHHRKHLPRE